MKAIATIVMCCMLMTCATKPAPVPVPDVNPPLPVVVTLAPNTATANSGATVKFTPTVINTTNTAVTWYLCGGTINNDVWTAPTVTSKQSICVSAISVADPSKSATSYVTVSPLTDKVSVTMSLFSGNDLVIGMPVVYSYTASSSLGMLNTITLNCGDGTAQVQNIGSTPSNGNTLTITGIKATTTSGICYPIIVGTLKPSITVTDSLGVSATAATVNTTLPVGCGNGVVFGYNLPSWISTLNWTNPADTIYGGTATNPTSTPTNQTTFLEGYTVQGTGNAYCVYLGAGGGIQPYTFSGVNLPPGLSITQIPPNGAVLGGALTASGTYQNIVLTVTDSKGVVSSLAPRSLTVCAPGATC